jgi:hypothetical protein
VKFHSKYVHARYVVVPDDLEMIGRRTRKLPGVAAVFEDHFWDSEVAQKEHGWDDETREMVEQHLLDHWDHGRTLTDLSAEQIQAAYDSTKPAPTNCLFVRVVDGSSWLCANPAVSDDGYCEQHAAEVHDAPKSKPNRRKEPVA